MALHVYIMYAYMCIMYACMYTCVYAVYACKHRYVCMYVCMYVCKYYIVQNFGGLLSKNNLADRLGALHGESARITS